LGNLSLIIDHLSPASRHHRPPIHSAVSKPNILPRLIHRLIHETPSLVSRPGCVPDLLGSPTVGSGLKGVSAFSQLAGSGKNIHPVVPCETGIALAVRRQDWVHRPGGRCYRNGRLWRVLSVGGVRAVWEV
jgi:hypothetical protein